MTEYELDKIKKSFVRSNAKCPVEAVSYKPLHFLCTFAAKFRLNR